MTHNTNSKIPKTPLQSFSELGDSLGASCWALLNRGLHNSLLAGCGSSEHDHGVDGRDSRGCRQTPTTVTTPPSTTVAPAGPFRSDLYGYMVTSLDWTGKSATTAWDGTGSPGNGDPTVDFLYGPDNQQAYAFGGPTTATLDEFVAASRAANHAARSVPGGSGCDCFHHHRWRTGDCRRGGLRRVRAVGDRDSRRTRLCVLHVRSAGQGSRDAGVVRIVDPSRCVRHVAPVPTSGDATSRSSRARRLLSCESETTVRERRRRTWGDRAACLSRRARRGGRGGRVVRNISVGIQGLPGSAR